MKLKLHTSLLALALGCIVNTSGQETIASAGSRPQFDVLSVTNDVMRNVEEPESIKAKSEEGRRMFADIDQAVMEDQDEQNSRSAFASGRGTEYVDTQEVIQAAVLTEARAAVLVNRTGVEASRSFDADGNPLSEGVAEVSAMTSVPDCVFDQANTDPCVSKFREPTGRCSHLEEGRRTWGMAGTPYARLLPNRYEDGISEYRTTEFSSGSRLLSPRQISETVTSTAILLHEDFSAQLMQWGQFMAHEFTLIGELEQNVQCCPDKIFHERFGDDVEPTESQLEEIRQEVMRLRGHVCIAIENRNDTVFGDHICMHQTRSAISPGHNCAPGPRQQTDFNTHFIDASAVYGSSKQAADKLRSFEGGKMKVQVVNDQILPPSDTSKCPAAAAAAAAARCPFLGGDSRINTTPILISMHAAFLVAHNRIADELADINPAWDDERLYQETRRIVAAIQTSIHYGEYLPLIIGERLAEKWLGNYTGYNPEVNPAVLNEMAGAAFRFGHSTIDGIFFTVDDEGRRQFNGLRENFFNHELVYERGATQHLRGLQVIAPWKVDNHFPTEMRDHLYDQKKDIVSFNINRGRDHGFASYNDYRRHYNLPVASSWAELGRTHPAHVVASLQQVYSTVEDIELYIGGVTEFPTPTGFVGELFGNMLGDGFTRLRDGDRLFYRSSDSGLTSDQIRAIESYSLAQLLCDGGNLTTTSRNAFFMPRSPSSESVDCSSFTKLNLSLWRDDGDANQNCEWRTTDITKCCAGRRTITRECTNESSSCQCEGDSVVTEDCVCTGGYFKCLISNFLCRYH